MKTIILDNLDTANADIIVFYDFSCVDPNLYINPKGFLPSTVVYDVRTKLFYILDPTHFSSALSFMRFAPLFLLGRHPEHFLELQAKYPLLKDENISLDKALLQGYLITEGESINSTLSLKSNLKESCINVEIDILHEKHKHKFTPIAAFSKGKLEYLKCTYKHLDAQTLHFIGGTEVLSSAFGLDIKGNRIPNISTRRFERPSGNIETPALLVGAQIIHDLYFNRHSEALPALCNYTIFKKFCTSSPSGDEYSHLSQALELTLSLYSDEDKRFCIKASNFLLKDLNNCASEDVYALTCDSESCTPFYDFITQVVGFISSDRAKELSYFAGLPERLIHFDYHVLSGYLPDKNTPYKQLLLPYFIELPYKGAITEKINELSLYELCAMILSFSTFNLTIKDALLSEKALHVDESDCEYLGDSLLFNYIGYADTHDKYSYYPRHLKEGILHIKNQCDLDSDPKTAILTVCALLSSYEKDIKIGTINFFNDEPDLTSFFIEKFHI